VALALALTREASPPLPDTICTAPSRSVRKIRTPAFFLRRRIFAPVMTNETPNKKAQHNQQPTNIREMQ
jgi:hypothetical protein